VHGVVFHVPYLAGRDPILEKGLAVAVEVACERRRKRYVRHSRPAAGIR
jgi:hypothetical protein